MSRSTSPEMAPSKAEGDLPTANKLSQTETAPSPVTDKHWHYDVVTDEMTNASVKMACTTSTNSLDFSFPYNGGSEGELCFRRKNKELNAWLKVSKGQFACGIDDCVLRFRFDDGAIQSFSASESQSNTTGLLFVNSASRLLTAVQHAKKLKLQANYYQEGQQVLYFDVGDLDTKQL